MSSTLAIVCGECGTPMRAVESRIGLQECSTECELRRVNRQLMTIKSIWEEWDADLSADVTTATLAMQSIGKALEES